MSVGERDGEGGRGHLPPPTPLTTLRRRPAGTQQAPGKPFIKLETTSVPLVLGFETVGDRDEAVDLLKQLKPAELAPAGGASKQGTSPGAGGKVVIPSAQLRQALFKRDKDLAALYEGLVVSGMLSEHDFWRTRKDLVLDKGSASLPAAARQRAGLPNSMLADVRPTADGQTEKVQFTLTPQTIQQARGEGGGGDASGMGERGRACHLIARPCVAADIPGAPRGAPRIPGPRAACAE